MEGLAVPVAQSQLFQFPTNLAAIPTPYSISSNGSLLLTLMSVYASQPNPHYL